jgi:uncharacterized protein
LEVKMKKINIILGSILVISILLLNGCNQGITPNKNTISATGVGETSILPDEVSVHIGVETLGENAEDSEQENALISDRVRTELFLVGISSSEVKTSNFHVYPEYNYREGREITGYRTTNNLVVKTSKFSKIGEIIDAAIKGGANRINSVQYELSEGKQSAAKKEALEEASRDAKEKAEAIAGGLGVKLGKIISVNSQDYYYNPRVMYAAEESGFEKVSAMADTMVIPQDVDTGARVIVVFEIG